MMKSLFLSVALPALMLAAAPALAADLIASRLPPDHQPYEEPVEVSIICAVERPQTTKLPHPRPDADNYGKALMDAMTQAGVWKDDSLVGRIAITAGTTAAAT